MKTIPVNIKLKYWQPYLPTKRHRKYRYRDAYADVRLKVDVVPKEEFPTAFILLDYSHLEDNKTIVNYYKGKFFVRMNMWDVRCSEAKEDDVLLPLSPDRLESLIRRVLYHRVPDEKDLPEFIKMLNKAAKRYVVVDGEIWEQTGEPRYVIQTFGLGHNHGGTALFVDNVYNVNIANSRYFSALDGAKAVAEADRIAAARGDTKDVGRFQEMIRVLMPETVKVKPMKQHGGGDPFMNTLEALTEKASSKAEAGLLTILATASEIASKK